MMQKSFPSSFLPEGSSRNMYVFLSVATLWILTASALPTWLSSLSTVGVGVASRYKEAIKSDLGAGVTSF